jgi:hypothetical protein
MTLDSTFVPTSGAAKVVVGAALLLSTTLIAATVLPTLLVASPQTGFRLLYMSLTELMLEQPANESKRAEAAIVARILRKLISCLEMLQV